MFIKNKRATEPRSGHRKTLQLSLLSFSESTSSHLFGISIYCPSYPRINLLTIRRRYTVLRPRDIKWNHPQRKATKGYHLYCTVSCQSHTISFGIKIGRAWPLEMDHLSCGRVSFAEVKEEFVQDGDVCSNNNNEFGIIWSNFQFQTINPVLSGEENCSLVDK